jgi:hypothetical protein
MDLSTDSLASWATILGTVISLFGLIQSRAWITATGVLLVAVSVGALLYARKEHRLVSSATLTVASRSLDSLNAANLNRRRNRSLVVQKAYHGARIEGENLQITWRYAGYCRAERTSAIEFSIDGDNNVPFEKLECFAHDLGHDPNQKHKIRPLLVGADGISKKISVPFLAPLIQRQGFDVILRCKLPGCMKAGIDYYSSTLSFDQPSIPYFTTRLVFVGTRPEWVRVYDCDLLGRTRLIKDLPPARQRQGVTQYVDVLDDALGQLTRVYLFQRGSV